MSAPFVWIFVCFSAGIMGARLLAFPAWSISVCVVTATCGLFARYRIAFASQALLIIVLSACIVQHQQDLYESNDLRRWARFNEGEVVAFQCVLLRTPEVASDYFTMRVQVGSIAGVPIRGVARITVSGAMKPALIAGDRVESFGRFRLPRNFQTEGAFDYERYLRMEGIHVLGSVKNSAVLRVTGYVRTIRRLSSSVRMNAILKTARSFSDQEGGILRALWLDDRGGLSQTDQQMLMDAGVFHIIAISGFHITVLVFLLFVCLKRIVSFRSAVLIACLLLAGYFLILEGRASVTRAFLSFLIFAFAVRRHDRISLANWISLSAWIQLTLNPLELYDSGFHLTYLSTAVILFMIVPLSGRLLRLSKAYRLVLSLVLTSLVLQIVLIPYQVYTFHRIPFYSVAANLVAVPVSSVLIALGVLFLPLPWTGLLIGAPIRALIHLFLGTAGFFSQQGVRILPSPQLWMVFLFYFTLAAFVTIRGIRWKCVLLVLSTLVLYLVLNVPPPEKSDRLRLHFLDVGQGDSILIEYPDETFDLVDGGGFFNSDALDTGQSILIPYLCKKGVTKLNRVFLTHAHADHMNGLITVLRYMPVNDLYVTRQPFEDRGYQYFLRTVAKSPIPICRGRSFRQGDVRLDVLAPEDSKKTRKVANDDSLVLLLQFQNRRLLLTGDVEVEAEARLAQQMDATVDFMKVPHHGSRTSSSEVLLRKIRPKIVVASLGFNNWFGHPHKEVLDRYKKGHTILYRTDRCGTIQLTVSRGYLSVILY